jgi:hypothetical protein
MEEEGASVKFLEHLISSPYEKQNESHDKRQLFNFD